MAFCFFFEIFKQHFCRYFVYKTIIPPYYVEEKC